MVKPGASIKELNKNPKVKKRFKALKMIACFLAVIGAHAAYQVYTGNFHEVIPNELYRSSQPSGQQIAEYHEKYGIRTILNLRDEGRGEWYEEEQAAAEKFGINLVGYPLDSSKHVSVTQSEALANFMKDLPKPILIHCEHGANRTGLASAIYVDAVANQSDFSADLQLTPYFGHIPIPGIGRFAMFSSYQDFQKNSDM